MSPSLDSPRRKIQRAEHHRQTYSAALDAFRRENPCPVIKDLDADTGEPIWVAEHDPTSPPVTMHPIIGDTLYNLRSALDHLAWQLVLANGGTPDNRTAFPLFDDAARYGQSRDVKLRGMSNSVKAAIDELQPCNGTNPFRVYWLSSLEFHSNIDKHRHFNLMTFAASGGIFNPGLPMHAAYFIHEGPVKRGTMLARVPREQMHVQFAPVLDIAFSDGPSIVGYPFSRDPVQVLLQALVTEVSRIVTSVGGVGGVF